MKSHDARRRNGLDIVSLFGIALAIGGITVLVTAQSALTFYESAKSWPAVPGLVVHAILHRKVDSDGTTYRAEIACRYLVDAQEYTTSRFIAETMLSDPARSARDIVSAFPLGAPVSIHVDPTDPTRAALIIGVPRHCVLLRRIGAAALTAGAGLAIYPFLMTV